MSQKALLVVDVQRDFCPGGALAISEGDTIIPALNRYIELFTSRNLPVFVSRDWHPEQTEHFEKHGGAWPVHCVQNTPGAAFHPDLQLPASVMVLSKGFKPGEDGYSAFQGVDNEDRRLQKLLNQERVNELFVGGLATDVCVRASVLDGLGRGLNVYLLHDATRGVEKNPGDVERAVREMQAGGAVVTEWKEVREHVAGEVRFSA